MDPFHLAVALNRCPVCGQGALFKGWLTLHDTCPVCQARYFRDPGNWTAPTAFGYGVGAAAAVATLLVLWAAGALMTWPEHLVAGLAIVVAIAVTLGTFRHVKAFWVAVLANMGHVYPDPPPQEASPDAT